MNHIVQQLNLDNENKLILDLGCGPGTWLMVKRKNVYTLLYNNNTIIRMWLLSTLQVSSLV